MVTALTMIPSSVEGGWGRGLENLLMGTNKNGNYPTLVLEALQFTTVCKMHTAFVVIGAL